MGQTRAFSRAFNNIQRALTFGAPNLAFEEGQPMEQIADMVTINGTHLYYEHAGSGHPLVLIHGFTLDTRMWEDQFAIFTQHYQAIRYDMRGFGRSALPTEEPFTAVEDLRALLDTLGVSRTFVLGLSRGGHVAIDFALMYPERTCALLLFDPALGGWTWSEAFSQSMRELEITAQTQDVDAPRQRCLAPPFFLPARERPGLAARLAQIVASYSGLSWLHASSEHDANLPDLPPLQRIKIPPLLLMYTLHINTFQ